MANILVTGGSGRIGRRLVERLISRGDSVTVIDTRPCPVKGAVSMPTTLDKSYDLEFDIVYHLAATIDYGASREELAELNVEPTQHLLEEIRGCRQLVFMSTTSVYADSLGPITEYSPIQPKSAYGWSKYECEQLVMNSGVPYTIIRSSQVFGPDFEEGYSSILKRIRDGKMKAFGKGDNCVPLVHVDDLVSALLLVKENPQALGQVLNVDGGYGKTQREFLMLAAKLLAAPPVNGRVNAFLAKLFGRLTGKGAVLNEYIDKLTRNRRMSIERIKKLGFEPKVDLTKGMKEVIAAFRTKGII